jgi:hypothetical protein
MASILGAHPDASGFTDAFAAAVPLVTSGDHLIFGPTSFGDQLSGTIRVTDLPANTVTADFPAPTIVGGPTALTEAATDSYVELTGGQAFRVGNGDPDGEGFGLFTLPEGATIQQIELVALCMTSERVLIPEGHDFGNETPATYTPTLGMTYTGLPQHLNLDPLQESWAEVSVPLPPSQWNYVIAGAQDPSFGGLSPLFYLGPDGGPTTSAIVQVAYMALRVTWTDGGDGTAIDGGFWWKFTAPAAGTLRIDRTAGTYIDPPYTGTGSFDNLLVPGYDEADLTANTIFSGLGNTDDGLWAAEGHLDADTTVWLAWETPWPMRDDYVQDQFFTPPTPDQASYYSWVVDMLLTFTPDSVVYPAVDGGFVGSRRAFM